MLYVIVSGFAIGMLFATIALVYNVMYSTSKVLSVTTGHIAMLGGVFGAYFVATLQLPWAIGLLGAVVVGAAFGGLTELLAIRRVLNRSDEHLWLLSTLALATMVQQGVGLWWGTEPKPFPRLITQDFSAGVLDQKFWLPIGVAVLMAVGLELFYRRTMYGKLFLAMSEDAFAARARGVSTDPAAIQKALENTKDFRGVYTTYSWSATERNGFPDSSMTMNAASTFKDGSFKLAPR